MVKTHTYKSDALSAVHETVAGLHAAGIVSKETLREFDESCLTQVHNFKPDEIARLRAREGVSQTVFAYYLNVSTDSVRKWEQGIKHPAGPSLKLLSLVEKKGLNSIA